MAETSGIAWTKSTFNPWVGCTRVSPGCDHCYAAVSTPARTLGIKWGPGEPRHRTSIQNWNQPIKWNRQAATTGEFWPVFCSSLADVFDNEVPQEWRTDLFALIRATPNLTWLLLTKRVGNAKDMIFEARRDSRLPGELMPASPLSNVWLGITVVNQEEADRDIPKLLAVPAAKRFLSVEPMLGPIEFSNVTRRSDAVQQLGKKALAGIDWVIVGGESDQQGMKARPFHVRWARSTVEQCQAADVAVFVKQLGSQALDVGCKPRCVWINYNDIGDITDRAGANPAEWPEDLRVQKFPL